jgi:hypothetical protein
MLKKTKQINAYKFSLERHEACFYDLGIDERIILKLIRKKQILGMWIGHICLMIVTSGGHENEHSGGLKGEEFLDQLSEYQLLKKVLFHGVC